MSISKHFIAATILIAVACHSSWAGTNCCEQAACCEPSCCEASCCDDSCCRDSCCGKPIFCVGPISDVEINGWISSGIFGNAYGAALNGPLGFNDVGDGYTLNQLWISIGKEADTGGSGVDWGVKFDYVFGVDGPDTQCFGDETWDFGWSSGRDYGSAIPQLYGEVAIDNLTIKAGHFYTIIGWEVVQAPDNFFYTHAYTMYYGEPFTHTGFLASYDLGDKLTVHGGWTDGWDNAGDPQGASTFLGGLSYSFSDDASLAWAMSTGTLGDFDGNPNGDVYMNSFVFEWNMTDRFTYIFQHDLGAISGVGATQAQWYGINQYFQYELNDRWAAGMRVEWFRDDDGVRIPVDQAGHGLAGNYYEITWGLNYTPCDCLMIRPELRYDWFKGDTTRGAPFDNNTKSAQFSGGFDLIYKF
ncbi:MAG: outer membrane beta-barrel protein [Pirellulales bacterium]|nr:outer membrane beta-barrel protein [Pirellulales bacterium]